MVERIVTRIGDIFCVEIDHEYKCYFQYVAKDMTMLNSSVIRVFACHYPISKELTMDEIINDDVDFYAHTVLRFGIENHAWYKVGKHKNIGNPENILFRMYDDIGNLSITKSYRWNIWRINQEQQFIGELTDEYIKLDLGIVFSYHNIVNKIEKGVYLFKHVD